MGQVAVSFWAEASGAIIMEARQRVVAARRNLIVMVGGDFFCVSVCRLLAEKMTIVPRSCLFSVASGVKTTTIYYHVPMAGHTLFEKSADSEK